ncbi:MAG: type I-F CRISPR-associated protein Csy2 [Lysobacter sp.]|nr:type I-F CRISPR-associated protein Csy2 [Lysobacter sp.]
MSNEQALVTGLLVLPRLRIQNANAISSPLTWGFPSITAFIGLMHVLERKLGSQTGLQFLKVGVICHGFEAQATQGGFTRSFHLTRNPVGKDGSTAAIVEEARAHIDISLVFEVRFPLHQSSQTQRQDMAKQVGDLVEGIRVAGGSVMPSLDRPGLADRCRFRPYLELVEDDDEQRRKAFRRLGRRLLPGFALVSRDDLLQARLETLRQTDEEATVLDAWLSLSRLISRATKVNETNQKTGEVTETVEWKTERHKGWLVPIPVGYAALSALHAPGEVANARDDHTPLRFVESVYSIGQWISPHRLSDPSDLLWFGDRDEATGLYRCINEFRTAVPIGMNPTFAAAAVQTN